jgi:hypothetical protein
MSGIKTTTYTLPLCSNIWKMHCDRLIQLEIDQIRNLQPDGWPDITDSFRFYADNDFCFPVKMSIGDKIVGIGNSIIFEKTAWLSHIIVNIEHRSLGIGFKIVEYLLNDIITKGIETTLLIATDLGEPVYKKAGFHKVSDYLYFSRENAMSKESFSDKITPYSDGLYTDIIKLDTSISGEGREKLLNKYLHESFVYIDNKEVKGFYLPHLGEGPIYAQTIEAGIELMKVKYSSIDKAVLPSENHFGIEFLRQRGFVESDTKGKRMILGKDIAWKPENIFSRIGGNFG